jgi:hypothetical protein
MNTVFLPPDTPSELSGKHMNSVSSALPAQLIAAASAANADQLGEGRNGPAADHDASHGGWDAYDVWRRFIRDARERRRHQD